MLQVVKGTKADIADMYIAESRMNQKDEVHYPQEFLNPLILNGLPPHSLKLKIGTQLP